MPPRTIALLEQLASVPLISTQIRKITDHNPVLAKVKQYTWRAGHLQSQIKKLQPYSSKRDELSMEDGILLWGSRVVVPQLAHDTVMAEAHSAHTAIIKMN